MKATTNNSTPVPNKKIVLVDDHTVVRIGLKGLIEQLGPYNVAWQFNNGKELIDAIHTIQDPSLIILDISMPVMDGLETLQQLKTLGHEIPVLVLTFDEDELQATRVFRLGGRGYLNKECSDEQLKEAIDEISSSGYYHNQYFKRYMSSDHKKTPREKILDSLTAKEKQFLKLVCDPEEYSYNQIASRMGTTLRSVDKCRETLFEKYEIKSKPGLILFVFKYRLTDFL